MNDTTTLFGTWRVIPVVVIESVAPVAPLADALVQAVCPCVEITLRTPAALEAVRAFAERPDIVVGAGSVRTAEQVDQAVEAGARFIVSPGLSDGVLDRCRDLDVPVLPGVATATEIMRALDAGLEVGQALPRRAPRRPGWRPQPGCPVPQHALRSHRRHRPVGPRGLPADPRRCWLSVAAGWSRPTFSGPAASTRSSA